MGCDIHSLAEVKNNGKWESVKEDIFREWGDRKTNSPFSWRNYNNFALLGNVRNGRGFAGKRTGDAFKSISSSRGIPGDASQSYIDLCQSWDGDGHSHSHVTLKELIECDYEQTREQGNSGDMITYRESVDETFFEIIENLKALHDDPEMVRVVFFFDN